MEQRFARALGNLQKLLEGASIESQIAIDFALIGGLAVATWGVVRATQDIDLLADSNPSPLRNPRLRDDLAKFLEKKGCTAEWGIGEPGDPIPLLLRVQLPRPLHRLGADILWAHKRWHQEALKRKIEIKVSGLRVSVLHPEDLIFMKLEAGGPQDLLDAQVLLLTPPPELNAQRLKRKASRLRLRAALEKCLRGASGKK